MRRSTFAAKAALTWAGGLARRSARLAIDAALALISSGELPSANTVTPSDQRVMFPTSPGIKDTKSSPHLRRPNRIFPRKNRRSFSMVMGMSICATLVQY